MEHENIMVQLPEEIEEKLGTVGVSMIQTIIETTVYMYGEEPTAEEVQEAGMVCMMVFKRKLDELFGQLG